MTEPSPSNVESILDELRATLRSRAQDVAESLLGPPNKAKSSRTELRWGNNGSVSVIIAGAKCGVWSNFEASRRGDLLALIMHERRCDFIAAVRFACDLVGIAFDGEGKQEAPHARAAREARQQADRDRRQAEAKADADRRIAFAGHLWAASGPIDGTPAERYLTETRGVPRPRAGWPANAVRYHSASRSLIMAGTDADGSVRFVQRVFLTPDGKKLAASDARPSKVTNGGMDGALVRLPGPADGPLLLAEGPETALSVWASTGYETRASIGPITRHTPPLGRRVVVCRDDDRLQSPADLALKRAMAGWAATGADVVSASPWQERRQDKSDFNDVIRTCGPEAVRARLTAALEPPHKAVNRLPVQVGRDVLQTVTGAFFGAAAAYDDRRKQAEALAKANLTEGAPFAPEVVAARLAWAEARSKAREARRLAAERPTTDDSRGAAQAASDAAKAARERARFASQATSAFSRETQKLQRVIRAEAKARGRAEAGQHPVHAIKVDVGAGKSEAALVNVARTVRALRAAGDKRPIVVAIPAHRLGDEQARRFVAMPEARGLAAAVWRSRKARLPDEQPMCLDLDTVADAEEAMTDVQTAVCRQVTSDGIRECPFYAECPFQRQRSLKPDVWFVAHELLFAPKPAVVKAPAVLVVDESAWQDGIFGTDSPIRLLLSTLTGESATVPGDPIASGQLRSSRDNLFSALSEMANGLPEDDTPRPVTRQEVIAHGIDVAAAREAYASEWKRKIDPDMFPGMARDRRKEAGRAAIRNKVIAKLGMLWKAVEHLVSDDGPEKSGWISLVMVKTTEGTAPAIEIKGRRNVHESWHVPTLLLDATMQPDLVRPFWPTLELIADIRLQVPHQHVTQVGDRSYSKAQLSKQSGRRNVHAILCREARRYAPARVLAVVQKAIEESLPDNGPLPSSLETAHHNAIAGRDQWGSGPGRDGVAALIVVGRTAPSPAAVEAMAEALTGAAVEPLHGWYEKADAAREMTDGAFRPAETDRHPNAIAEAIRWQIAEGELIQIIGRPRGVNRTAANPVDVLLMTNAVLPVQLDRIASAADLEPSPNDLMMAAGGVAFENPTDAAEAYPDLWASRDAAKKAMQRHSDPRLGTNRNKRILITECPQPPARITYQRSGAGRSKAVAWADLRTVPDPTAWLTERLGPLASIRIDEPTPTPAAIAKMTDAEKLALRARLQASGNRKNHSMTDTQTPARSETEPEGIDPARLYPPAVAAIDTIDPLAGLWSVSQGDREPIRIADRRLFYRLIRSRLNRINWLQPPGFPVPVGVVFLAPCLEAA